MEIERAKQGSKDINMIPLINIIFLLLIFFLIGGTIEKFEVVHVEIPRAESGKILDEGQIVVVLGPNDEVVVQDDWVEMQDLTTIIAGLIKADPHHIITIRADQRLPAKTLIAVLERVKSAGGENLSLITTSN